MELNKEILFSIVIATFNRASIIRRSILSIINQTYTNWELIVVDDGSTDNTEEVVNSFEDARIKYFYKKNEDKSIARNFGIDKATGEYISFLDDDDYYLPGFLSKFNEKIQSDKFPASVYMCYESVEKGKDLIKNRIPIKYNKNPIRLLWEIQTSIRPFVISKEVLNVERFKEDCKYGEDFHLIMRIVLKNRIHILNEYLSVNVIHENQGTHSKFSSDIRENANLSIMCLDNLVNNYYSELIKNIPAKIIFDRYNHIIYGFSSAAMKQCEFSLLLSLMSEFKFKGKLIKINYYYLSILLRLPYYFLKCLIKNRK